MPALMESSKQETCTASEREMDNLVEEVRERLCLKSREKLSAARRAMPYSSSASRRKGSAFVLNHDLKCVSEKKERGVSSKRRCRTCSMKYTKCSCSSSLDIRGSRDLLNTLLAEQRLIDEAVRRIHGLHHQYGGDTSSATTELTSSCSVRSSSSDSMDSSTFSSTQSVDF